MRKARFDRLGLSTQGMPRTKMKLNRLKKKQKKAMAWLNMDSPYAEYLPARYREWYPKNA